jgi:hypothetical protein
VKPRYFARKTECALGHKHASAREAARCAELHNLFRAGKIDALAFEPQYWFDIEGRPVKHANGRRVGYKPDFSYLENGRVIVEDVKARNGFMERDVPLRMALFRHLFPSVELRVVT